MKFGTPDNIILRGFINIRLSRSEHVFNIFAFFFYFYIIWASLRLDIG
jgi:hypothetical protein